MQKEIAQVTCECERHIGTQSGGMDQVKCHTDYFSVLVCNESMKCKLLS